MFMTEGASLWTPTEGGTGIRTPGSRAGKGLDGQGTSLELLPIPRPTSHSTYIELGSAMNVELQVVWFRKGKTVKKRGAGANRVRPKQICHRN